MPQCPTCGRRLDDAARFCPNDGTTIRPDTVALPSPVVSAAPPPKPAAAPAAPPPRPAAAPAAPPPRPAAPSPAKADDGHTSDEIFAREQLGSTPTEAQGKADPLVGAVLDGRYRIKARLGQGGVGAVYAGEHVETKRPVAVKVLHSVFAGSDEFHKRFEREARAASKLTHPSCVSVLDYGRVERVEPVSAGGKLLGIPYLVMEFVRGTSLADRVGKPMPPAEAVVIVRGVLSALRHAHGLGIVHRDVKPANVMLVDGGGTGLVVKLLDFGLAKMSGESENDGEAPLTQAGMVFGTPGYLSPEQAAGYPADARSDIYAVGIVLYELVAGRRPFLRSDPLDVVRDHLNTLPPPPRSFGAQISNELEQVILKALAKEPKARYQTAEELSAALADVPELRAPSATMAPSPLPMSPSTPADPRPPSAPASVPRIVAAIDRSLGRVLATIDRRALIAGGAGLLALIVLVLVIELRPSAPPPPALAPPLIAPPPATAPALSEGARRHLAMAESYQRKLWCSDALEELDRALRDAPELRDDAEPLRIAIACLTPKTRDKAIRFLVEKVGAPAHDALQQAAQSDGNAEVRRGAEKALERLR